jgi:hypothetical protein
MVVPHAWEILSVAHSDGERRIVWQAIFRQTERNPFVKANDFLHIVQKTD